MSLADGTVSASGSAWSKFTGPHLWGAAHFAREAYRIEQEGLALPHPPDNHSLVQHHVVATILLAAAAAEAFPSELAAPADGLGRDPSGAIPKELSDVLGRASIAPKYTALAAAVGTRSPNRFMQREMEELRALVLLRNKLVHFSPELPGSRKEHDEVEERLRTRITLSPLLPGAELFPDGFGSYSCAKWSVATARGVIEAFAAQVRAPIPFLTKPAHLAKMLLP